MVNHIGTFQIFYRIGLFLMKLIKKTINVQTLSFLKV